MALEHRYIGIDPGKKGYVVVLDQEGKIVEHYKTPLIGKKLYDKQLMSNNFYQFSSHNIDKPYRCHAVLEDIHANTLGGKASNFDLGNGKGLWEMALMSLEIPHTMVTPKEWQKLMWQGVKIQYLTTSRKTKKGNPVKKIDTKSTSLAAAKMLMPHRHWYNIGLKGDILTTINDGFVDAYLMAEYCRRKFR